MAGCQFLHFFGSHPTRNALREPVMRTPQATYRTNAIFMMAVKVRWGSTVETASNLAK